MFYWGHAVNKSLSAHFKSIFTPVFTDTSKIKSALRGNSTIGSLLTEDSNLKKA